jgi:hypothetical protein
LPPTGSVPVGDGDPVSTPNEPEAAEQGEKRPGASWGSGGRGLAFGLYLGRVVIHQLPGESTRREAPLADF